MSKKCSDCGLYIDDEPRACAGPFWCGCSEGLPQIKLGDICVDWLYHPKVMDCDSDRYVKKNIVAIHRKVPGVVAPYWTEIYRRPGARSYYIEFHRGVVEPGWKFFLIVKLEKLRDWLEGLLDWVTGTLERLVREQRE